jgi:hypothetical protein
MAAKKTESTGRMTLGAYASSRGYAPQAVIDARNRGRITVGADGLVDPAGADAEWARNTNPRKGKGPRSKTAKAAGAPALLPVPAGEMPTLADSVRRKEAAQALKAELDVERLKASWRAPALRLIAEEAARVRSSLEQLADRHYATLAAKHAIADPEAFRRDLEDAIREHLAQLAREDERP